MRNNPIIVWRMVLLSGMWSCVSPAWAGSTADELALIEAEHVVLKARLRLIETRAQIAARQADIDRQSPFTHGGLPTVVGIEGLVGRLSATLVMDNGFMTQVQVGDTLPNGARVVAIAPHGVTVETAGKQRLQLRSASESPAAPMEAVRSPALPAAGFTARGMPAPAQAPGVLAIPSMPPAPRAPAASGAAR